MLFVCEAVQTMKRFLIACTLLAVIIPAAVPEHAAPLARTGTYTDKVPAEGALRPEWAPIFSEAFRPGTSIEFELYVPKTYDPSKPAGILTYISPSRSGAIPNTWKRVIDQRNLIWVSVDHSGNDRTVQRRMAEALASADYVRNHYRTDETRTYIAGFSGGGRMASMISYYFADLFEGALYICGANTFPEQDPVAIARMRMNRFVFLTGTEDFNEDDTRGVFDRYKAAGMDGIKIMVVQNLHHELPRGKDFDTAMDWLDQPPGP